MRVVDASCTHSALLPRLFATLLFTRHRPALYLALEGNRLLGAAYLGKATSLDDVYLTDFYLVPGADPAGVIGALMARVVTESERLVVPRVKMARELEDCEVAEALLAAGFKPETKLVRTRVDVDKALVACAGLRRRLGRVVPHRDRLATLPYRAPQLQQVDALCAARFGAPLRGHLVAADAAKDGRVEASASAIFTEDGRVIASAAILMHGDHGLLEPWLVVDERNWLGHAVASAELMFENAKRHGAKSLGGVTPDAFTAMHRLHRMFSAEIVGHPVTFGRTRLE